ncbi:MAG: CrcB family protein [Lachnospiraceae bacterium]|nr:CrcB family protein [Lachnospiraceae bacterium]
MHSRWFIYVALGGAILIGFVVGLASSKKNISPNTILFLKTGVCGGFTTFSTFSLEAMALIDHNSYIAAGLYIFLSVLGCLLGVLCGQKLAKII